MTPAFKHRLLGTAILVTAGIIFLPDLLDGEKQIVKDDFKVIPNRPEFKGVQQQQVIDQQAFEQIKQEVAEQPVDEPVLDTDVQTEPSLPETQVATVTAPAVQQRPTKMTNPALQQAGWVVRVGSFSKEQNANALVAKLRQAGFVTFTRRITNSDGLQLTSVLVGPELKKDKLEQQLPKLQQLTGISRLTVINYQPTENN